MHLCRRILAFILIEVVIVLYILLVITGFGVPALLWDAANRKQ